MRFVDVCKISASMLVFVSVNLMGISQGKTPHFQGLGDLPGRDFYSYAYGVSGDGSVVVGNSRSASGSEAFIWTASGGMVGLGDLPGGGFESIACGASGDGSVVVGFSDSGSDEYRQQAFLWTTSGGMEPLGHLPGGTQSAAFDVSADGSVVVGYSNSVWGTRAFRYWTASGIMESLGGSSWSYAYGVSSDGSVVVGEKGPWTEAFCWTEQGGFHGLGDLPGGDFHSIAEGVSADGSVVVGHSCVGLVPVGDGSFRVELEAFRWTPSEGMKGLGDLPGGYFYSYARDVSADGTVVIGGSHTDLGGFIEAAFLWEAEHGMRNLEDVLESDFGLDLTGWTLYAAMGISDDGLTIVGHGRNPDGFQEAWMAQIPEPATFLLMGLGCLVLRREHGG